MKISRLIVASICVVAGLFGGWYLIKNGHEKKCKKICMTEYPVKRDLLQYVTASGNLKALEEITIGSLVTGRVIERLVDDNDIVKKNQLLAVIDNGVGDSSVKLTKAQLDQAVAQCAFTEKFYKRQTALYNSGQLAKNLFDQYTQDITVARAKVEELKGRLEIETKTYENLFIRSPDDGIVIARLVDVGQMVASAFAPTVLFTIAKDMHKMEAWLDVDEADIGQVAVDQEAFFTVDSFPEKRFSATVKRVRYQSKNVDNVITFATVLGVENPDLKLRPGMTTNVEIKVADAHDALSISNKALRVTKLQVEEVAKKNKLTISYLPEGSVQDKGPQKKMRDFVWVLDNDKVIRQVRIALGVTDGKCTQIISGLTANDIVITDVDVERENVVMKAFASQSAIGK